MNGPKEIYLQPECCADPCIGRVWCEDDAPEECEDGNPWTRYVRADRYTELQAEIDRLNQRVAELEAELAPCRAYQKDGETLAECLERNRRDAGRAIRLYGELLGSLEEPKP